MSAEENRALVNRHTEEFWNQSKLEIAEEIHAADFLFHSPSSPDMRGIEAYNQFAIIYRTAFPDLRFTTEDVIVEGDKVVERWTSTATQQGELMGIPPTGKWSKTSGISIFRVADGKLAEQWVNWDMLGMLQQLGVIPPLGGGE